MKWASIELTPLKQINFHSSGAVGRKQLTNSYSSVQIKLRHKKKQFFQSFLGHHLAGQGKAGHHGPAAGASA